jgi:hypothetical protein
LDIEIWFKDQIEGEEAPFLMDLEDVEKRAWQIFYTCYTIFVGRNMGVTE